MYIASLVDDPAGYLMGLSDTPDYLFDRALGESATRISEWWKQRWVLARVARQETHALLERHNHVHPIRHGARVLLPDPDLDQPGLFTE